MNEREIEEVVGEAERLQRVHEALVAAGPPPELPPGVAVPYWRREPPKVRTLPRRRLGAALVLAAALAAASFGGGYLLGARSGGEEVGFAVDFVLVMRGTEAVPSAIASLAVGEIDEAGNWPMKMTVRGLPSLPEGALYELVLTKDGREVASCGYFEVAGTTDVFLNAPYRLREYDGWIVTRADGGDVLLRTDEI